MRSAEVLGLGAAACLSIGACVPSGLEGNPDGTGGTVSTGGSTSGGATSTGGGGIGAFAGAGGIGGAGGQGTGAQAGGENCANGVDDDDDQLVDCADSDCVPTWECTLPPPADWEGPALFLSGPTGTVPACAPPWTTEFTGGNGLTAPNALCNDCSCGAPNIDCSMGALRIYNNGDCSDQVGTEAPASPNTCFYGNESDPDGYRATLGSPLGSSNCAAGGGGVESLPAASWDEDARLCLGTVHAGGCTNDNLCVPRTDLSPFARCIYRAGSFSCPPPSQPTSPYTEAQTFNSAMAEGRSCSACACDTPGNIQCHGQYSLWDAASLNCVGTPEATVPTTSPCVTYHDISGNFAIEFTAAYTSDPCQVSAGSGQPTGTVTETTPFTVCCLP